jgi:hypothetical protein
MDVMAVNNTEMNLPDKQKILLFLERQITGFKWSFTWVTAIVGIDKLNSA